MEAILAQTTTGLAANKARCVRGMQIMADGDLDELAGIVHPDAVNREAEAEPPAARGRGPAAFHATATWLRAAFADLRWDVHEAVADGDIVVVHTTMRGRQVGPFVTYDQHGEVAQAFPPTGRSFAVTQTHWFRLADDLIIEHWANRDDLGQAAQLGWVPPTPAFLIRMAWTKRRARHAATRR